MIDPVPAALRRQVGARGSGDTDFGSERAARQRRQGLTPQQLAVNRTKSPENVDLVSFTHEFRH
jgi:hypothetical protein